MDQLCLNSSNASRFDHNNSDYALSASCLLPLRSAPSLSSADAPTSASASFAITFSNCDHSASTEPNSFPTLSPSVSAIVPSAYPQVYSSVHTAMTPSKLRFNLFIFWRTCSRLCIQSSARIVRAGAFGA